MAEKILSSDGLAAAVASDKLDRFIRNSFGSVSDAGRKAIADLVLARLEHANIEKRVLWPAYVYRVLPLQTWFPRHYRPRYRTCASVDCNVARFRKIALASSRVYRERSWANEA